MAYTQLGLDIGSTVKAASKIIEDPALPAVTCEVLRLNRVVEGKSPGPSCSRRVFTAAEKRKGVGLHLAVQPLRIATWARANPALAIGGAAAVVGGLVWIGYAMGRKRR